MLLNCAVATREGEKTGPLLFKPCRRRRRQRRVASLEVAQQPAEHFLPAANAGMILLFLCCNLLLLDGTGDRAVAKMKAILCERCCGQGRMVFMTWWPRRRRSARRRYLWAARDWSVRIDQQRLSR